MTASVVLRARVLVLAAMAPDGGDDPPAGKRRLDPAAAADHVDRLLRAAWGLCGSREDAEDLVQETYARVFAKPRLLSGEDDLPYLLRVLRNTYFSKYRSAARAPAEEVIDEEMPLADPRGTFRPDVALEANEVLRVVASLPEEFRDVLVAVDVTGLSYKETARALKIREGTVMSRLSRAREKVIAALAAQTVVPD
jgi:RNA polymerase sigma-70 factor (ECF subfamily)